MAAALVVAATGYARAEDWEPVDKADLAATASSAFPGADAEILLSKHKYADGTTHPALQTDPGRYDFSGVLENFVRVKIYTSRGVDQKNKIRIRSSQDLRATDLAARVVKPNGSYVELTKADFIESVVADEEYGETLKQIVFALPGLAVGDVVEYRWNYRFNWAFWLFYGYVQDELPTREYRFYLKEMADGGALWWVHCPNVTTENKHGFTLVSRNIPAFEEEPHMPPMKEECGWYYITREYVGFNRDSEIWPLVSHDWAATFEKAIRGNGAIKRKAEALTAGTSSDDEKLQRLYEFCQSAVVNVDYSESDGSRRFSEKHRDEEPAAPEDVLRAERGRADEINLLFGALAHSAGFEVRSARFPLNTELTNVKLPRACAFFRHSCVAVKAGDHWRFFDPGSYFIPFGLTDSLTENVTSLIADLRKIELAEIPASSATANSEQRKATLKLDAEGSLEGDIEESFSGQSAVKQKERAHSVSENEWAKKFVDAVTKRLPNAEVSKVVWTNLRTQAMPVKVTYHVRVPGYAQHAGKRLVLLPSYFCNGCSPEFTAPDRKYPIFFPYPWSEHDEVAITLPEGYALDQPSAPIPVGGANAGVISSAYRLRFDPKARVLSYQREFALGAGGACRFQAESYPALKQMFEAVSASDCHVLMLKPIAAPASNASEAKAEPAAPPHS